MIKLYSVAFTPIIIFATTSSVCELEDEMLATSGTNILAAVCSYLLVQ